MAQATDRGPWRTEVFIDGEWIPLQSASLIPGRGYQIRDRRPFTPPPGAAAATAPYRLAPARLDSCFPPTTARVHRGEDYSTARAAGWQRAHGLA